MVCRCSEFRLIIWFVRDLLQPTHLIARYSEFKLIIQNQYLWSAVIFFSHISGSSQLVVACGIAINADGGTIWLDFATHYCLSGYSGCARRFSFGFNHCP